VSNPPFHTGLAVDYSVTEAFLTGARAALNPGGQVAIVANRFIRYERFLQAHFPVVRVLAETGKFRVLQASL
jgi:16S rRNA (guanine1207-N2)-methyltransferase